LILMKIIKDKPLGEIRLISTKVRKITDTGKPFCLEMTTHNAVYHIATDKEQDLIEWIDVIDRLKENIFTKGGMEDDHPSPVSSPSPLEKHSSNANLSNDDKDKKNISSINLVKKKFQTLNRPNKKDDFVISVASSPAIITSPSPSLTSPTIAPSDNNEPPKSKKESVIFEIINTERDYVNDLDIILNVSYRLLCFFLIMIVIIFSTLKSL
jgi:hypothetical protein